MRPKIISPVASRLLAIVLIPFITVLIAEVGARLILHYVPNPNLNLVLAEYADFENRADAVRFIPDIALTYRLRPNFTLTAASGAITHHNQQGFRNSRDFEPKNPEDLRVVCLGGSTTYGVGVEDNSETYPARLEQQLRKSPISEQYRVIEVFNLGVGGYTSLEVLRTLESAALPLDPDIILIQIALNDVGPRFYPNFACDYSHFRLPMAPLESNLFESLLHKSTFAVSLGWAMGYYKPFTLQARTQKNMPTLETARKELSANGTTCFEDHIRDAVSLAKASAADVYLLTEPYRDTGPTVDSNAKSVELESLYKRGLAEHNAVLLSIAATTDAEIIDLNQLMPRDAMYFVDPIHMTAAGNQVKAELIASKLNLL